MPQNYTPEFKKIVSVSTKKRDVLTKASPLNMAYPKPAFSSGAVNYAENARQARKAKKNTTT